jgi:FixJ family two-component response regulator
MLLGAHCFIEKPYDFRKLVAAIERAASAGQPNPAAPAAAAP